MALTGKNTTIVHSSSYMLGNSVRVHVNPILQDLVIDGRLHSDLEFALQNGDVNMQTALSNSVRSPQYGNQSDRHETAASIADKLDTLTEQIDDLTDDIQSLKTDNPTDINDKQSVTSEN